MQTIKTDDVNDIRVIEPDWKAAFQTLYGFCLGKGLGDEIEKCKEIQSIIKPKFLIPSGMEV